ncbi:hypothetical protein CC86DRAFT_373711 [Ophiobolus disseminans]|uniref:Uncharacterized protein n=1 Tax=Ophiobolus disseminans TaxID=1469910 RepID=A0A6A6ZM03_9PLEO|nr:hypothetical protein CC86DRAFT_373711 [Ophiobolus disseminans]
MPGHIIPLAGNASASTSNDPTRITKANLDTLQVQLNTARANGSAQEKHRKAMCRVQKAGYEMDFSVSAVVLQESPQSANDWIEEHSL